MNRPREFGSLVKDLRMQRRMTLREFCRRTGFDPGNWSKIERGILQPTRKEEWITIVCSTLDLDIYECIVLESLIPKSYESKIQKLQAEKALLVDALDEIMAVTGTSTKQYHIARNILAKVEEENAV